MPDDAQLLDLEEHQILAAIVSTHAVDFSAQISKDEEHALALIRRDLLLMTDICQPFEGKVLKVTDDGLLISFLSPVGAVACALEIQKALAAASSNLPPQDVLQHRIGIHLGEVSLTDSDVMGDGVEVVTRLQAVAEPNGICLSQTVYDAVKNGLALQAAYLGLKKLDNIAQAVPVYQIILPETPATTEGEVLDSGIYLTREEYRDRQILIKKVKDYWIKGALETSLHGRALMALDWYEKPDALELPWGFVWQTADTQQLLPPGSPVIDKFNQLETGQTLLILGEPGSGKTTTLLTLTRDLIVRAEHDYMQPIPVVFNLSSWKGEKQSIRDWLVEELYTKYQAAKEIGINWVKNQQLLLMLDGLDEVSAKHQDACIQAINQFSEEYGQTPIVVTSRIQDYEVLSNRLKLQGAICLKPLNLEQVHQYLNGAGSELAAVRRMLQEDPILQELVRSPAMLNIIALTYRGKFIEALPQGNSLEEYRQFVFNDYIERMFKRRGSDRYPKAKVMRWLIWLAKQMLDKSQSVFLIESLQTSWLQNIWQKFIYIILIILIAGVVCGLGAALNVTMIAGWEIGQIVGVVFGGGAGLIAGIIFGFIYDKIQPVETLKWSRVKARNNLKLGLLVELIAAGISALLGGLFYTFVLMSVNGWLEGLSFGLRVGVGVALLVILLSGLTSPRVEANTIPNQGIWQSVNTAMMFFLLGAIGLGLVSLILGLPILVGAIAGLIFGIFCAGEASLKHFALRLVLYCNGYIPWNYARFLGWACDRIFLQKVGGGYIFVHRLLLEHFAQIK